MAAAEDPAARNATPSEVGRGTSGGRGDRSGLRVGGWIFAGLGAVFVIAGVALIIIHLTQRDSDGYYTSSTKRIAVSGYAVTSEGLHLGDIPGFATDAVGTVRITARSNTGQPLFVGIAREPAALAYLGGVARSEVTDVSGDSVSYRAHPGTAPAGPPARQGFWQAAKVGNGQVTATWKVKGGTWVVVLMNASAAADINANVSIGVKTNLVLWVGLGAIIIALIFAGVGSAMIVSSRSSRPVATSPPAEP